MSSIGQDVDVAAVAAFLFVRIDPEPRILLGVRSTETNARHPGVVSIPTMRIPPVVARALAGREYPLHQGVFRRVNGVSHQFGVGRASVTTEGLLVESVLSRKLQLGDSLERGEVAGTCAVRRECYDEVDDPTGRDGRVEPTRMITIVATCERGADRLAVSSASYDPLVWTEPEKLVSAWRMREAQRLFPDANPFEICIRGLCIRSAVDLVTSPETTEQPLMAS